MPRKRDSTVPAKKRRQALAQAAWIEAFRRRGTKLGACDDTGIDRKVVRDWMKDPDFAQRFDDCDEDVTDMLKASAISQALKPEGTIDRIFLLKARRPEIYRDRLHVEATGKDGAPLHQPAQVVSLPLHLLSEKAFRRLGKLLDKEST